MSALFLGVMLVFFVFVFWFVWSNIAADLPDDFLTRFIKHAREKRGR